MKIKAVLSLILTVIFVIGAIVVFSNRFESGNLYPPYSTHRSSPTGSKALYQTMKALPTLAIQRLANPADLNAIKASQEDIFFLIGTDPIRYENAGAPIWETLDEKIAEGATVIVALNVAPNPFERMSRVEDKDDAKGATEDPDDSFSNKDSEPDQDTDTENPTENIFEQEHEPLNAGQWLSEKGLSFEFLPKKEAKSLLEKVESANRFAASPKTEGFENTILLNRPVVLRFDEESDWTSLYSMGEYNTIAQMQSGPGRLIIVSDSYLFSNEAIAYQRASEFLSYLIQDKSYVHFVEMQLGIVSAEGVMSLARRNGFTAAFVLIALAAAFFVWSSAFSQVPRLATENLLKAETAATGANAGKVNLIMDSLPKSKIMLSAFQEWIQTSGKSRVDLKKQEQAETIIKEHATSGKRGGDIATTYNRILQLFTNKDLK